MSATATLSAAKPSQPSTPPAVNPGQQILQMVAGFWVLRVDSIDDVIAWTETFPFPDGDDARLEIRELWRMEDLIPA